MIFLIIFSAVIIMFFELLHHYIIVTHIIKINQISHLFFKNLFQ